MFYPEAWSKIITVRNFEIYNHILLVLVAGVLVARGCMFVCLTEIDDPAELGTLDSSSCIKPSNAIYISHLGQVSCLSICYV